MVDWDNITKEEYMILARMRREMEADISKRINDFVAVSGLEVSGIQLVPPNPHVPILLDNGDIIPSDSYRVFAHVPMRVYLFDE